MNNNGNLFQIISDNIQDNNKIFLQEKDGKKFTYSDVQNLSAKYANTFKAMGISKGDRVAVQTGKLVDCIWIYLSLMRIGAIYLPLNTAYIVEEIKYFLRDANPKLFISGDSFSENLSEILSHSSILHETINSNGNGSLQKKLKGFEENFENEIVKKNDIACILYTSGTTGKSKGAMITHENLSSNAFTLVESWKFTNKDVLLHALPIYHVHGLFVAINTILLANASILFLKKFDTDLVISELLNVTSMMGVPTYYNRLVLNNKFNSNVSRHIRVFISGSAPLSVDVFNKFKKITGHSILERYGMTETGMISSNPYAGERKPGTVGFPLKNIDVRIANPNSGKILRNTEIGVIEVKGPNIFKGYWKMPEKTNIDFRSDGYFITGDLGFIDGAGYISISGRDKDLIISGGLNVYPAEIENAIDTIDEVDESAVIGLPHNDFGEAVTAIIVLNHKENFEEKKIIDKLDKVLARYKVPKKVIVVDLLPRNSMGKIQKKNLREKYSDLYK